MRPAYETFVEAMKKDINRISDRTWDRSCQQLFDVATKEERRYLKQELTKLKYEYAEVSLGKLILGVIDDTEGQFVPTFYESSTPIIEPKETNPNQMELDL